MSGKTEHQWRLAWPEFVERVQQRLVDGEREYGNESFELPHSLLIANLAEELLDVVGWGFILHCRLMELSGQLDDLLAQMTGELQKPQCTCSSHCDVHDRGLDFDER